LHLYAQVGSVVKVCNEAKVTKTDRSDSDSRSLQGKVEQERKKLPSKRSFMSASPI